MADLGTTNPVIMGTGGELVSPPEVTETRVAAADLTEEIGFHRSRVRGLNNHVEDLHKDSHQAEWRMRTIERAKAPFSEMLDEVADLGFAWRDLARMMGVSVPAIQKWRRGKSKPSGENRRRVASLLAACDLVAEHYMVAEVASWFEMPLVPGVPVTPIELFGRERVDLVFDFASGQSDPEALMTQFDAKWRTQYMSDFEVFEGCDGYPSLRLKG